MSQTDDAPEERTPAADSSTPQDLPPIGHWLMVVLYVGFISAVGTKLVQAWWPSSDIPVAPKVEQPIHVELLGSYPEAGSAGASEIVVAVSALTDVAQHAEALGQSYLNELGLDASKFRLLRMTLENATDNDLTLGPPESLEFKLEGGVMHSALALPVGAKSPTMKLRLANMRFEGSVGAKSYRQFLILVPAAVALTKVESALLKIGAGREVKLARRARQSD